MRNSPGDPASVNVSHCIFLKILHPQQLQSCYLRWPSFTDYPDKTSNKLYTFLWHRVKTKNNFLSLSGLHHYSKYLWFPKDTIAPRQQKQSKENNAIFPRSVVFGHSMNYGCLSSLGGELVKNCY